MEWYQSYTLNHRIRSILREEEQRQEPVLSRTWLDICSHILKPENALGQKYTSRPVTELEKEDERHDRLREFTTTDRDTGISGSQRGSFSRSLIKFYKDPDGLISCLKGYNRDIRVRDLSEEMLGYALDRCQEPGAEEAFYSLMERLTEILNDSMVSTKSNFAGSSRRVTNLTKLLRKAEEAPARILPGSERSKAAEAIRKYVERTVDQDDVGEAASK